jgi:4-amino-4-deoxy-L-arabinose transferase-like glycosyltransferase
MPWEFAAVHFLNFFIYLASFAAFQIFLKELLHSRELQEKIDVSFVPLSPRRTQTLANILFLWSAQFWLSPSIVNPDLAVAALVYLATALLIRMTRTGANWPTWILLGVVLGIAYLAKTAMFPLGFVFLVCAFFQARRKHPRPVQTFAGAALALLIFLGIAAPWISAISHAKHRWTFGDSGRIAYAEYVNKATLTTHWQGQPPGTGVPLHPTRQISADPPIFEFAQPIPGSYPPWYDPSYWYDGIHPHFSLRGQLWVLFRALNMYFKMFSKTGALYVVLLVFVIAGKRHGRLQRVSPEMWLVIVPSIAALFMYALVLVELRYVSPFALLLLVWTLSRAESLPTSAASFATNQKFFRCAILAPSLAIAWPVIRDARTAIRNAPYEDWQVAIALPGFGVRPGSSLAYIGSGGDAYWAHLAGDRLIAEIPGKDQSALLAASPEKRFAILRDLVRLGADGVVTKNAAVAHATRDWERIGNTQYYIWRHFVKEGSGVVAETLAEMAATAPPGTYPSVKR